MALTFPKRISLLYAWAPKSLYRKRLKVQVQAFPIQEHGLSRILKNGPFWVLLYTLTQVNCGGGGERGWVGKGGWGRKGGGPERGPGRGAEGGGLGGPLTRLYKTAQPQHIGGGGGGGGGWGVGGQNCPAPLSAYEHQIPLLESTWKPRKTQNPTWRLMVLINQW